jgi:hypothetical protein
MASVTSPEMHTRRSVVSRAVEEGEDSFSAVAGISGLVFVLLLVGPLFGFGLGPSPTSGPRDVAAYYAQHAGVLQSIQVLRALSTVCFLVFLAGVWDVLRTRPLCPYPLVARWTGQGSTDEAANFACTVEIAGG